jgi:ribose-phosphate pyrophosphokinase
MIFLNGQQVLFNKFPNGETKLNQVDEIDINFHNVITFIYESDQDLINLMILKQWLDYNYNTNNDYRHELELLYMPYSRMDRKIDYHEPTLHTMLNYLKYLNFNGYIVYDPHSNEELYNYLGFHVVNQLRCTRGEIAYENIHKFNIFNYTRNNNITVLAPDKGAEKKSLEIANYYDLPFMLALKVRDVITGNITDTQILGNVKDKNLFIFDDIIDGGATFIELARVAKANGANDLYLYATHGIFSKGTSELEKYFKHIFVYHTFIKECDSENITVLRKKI